MSDAAPPAAPEPPLAKRGRLHPALWAIIVSVMIVVLVALGVIGTRYGLVSSPGRLFVESRLSGLKLGRIGRLKIEGLQGDVFRDFTVTRLTISDEKGVWLEGRNVHVTWHYGELFFRRFHADQVVAQKVTLIRRPTLTPKGKSKELPVSFVIDSMKARIETLPDFSYRRGLFDFSMRLKVERKGGDSGHIEAHSLLQGADFLRADFDVGRNKSLNVVADAREDNGGAIAGALGLPVDKPFALSARANGTTAVGRFAVVARSGDTTPINALGAWNGNGGSAAGRLSLASSSIMKDWVGKLGPEAKFSVGGRKRPDGAYALDGKIDADNLHVTFKGPADLIARRLTPAGLAVTLDTGSIQRLFGGVEEAKAHAAGVLKGGWSDWTYSARLDGRDFTIGSYRLASLSGPAQLSRRKGVFVVSGELNGAGGGGRGYLGAALGARPHGTFVGSREKSGEYLIRRVVITGPGAVVDAAGKRTIFGNYSFQGSAQLSQLQAWHPGAKGLVKASWSAGRAGGEGDRPWTYDFDAKGTNFAAGWSEFDRLMGNAPRLRAKGTWNHGVIGVADSTLDGAQGSVRAKGIYGRDRSLQFTGDWNAKGPFRAGPVEIAGNAKGSGAVTGTLSTPRADIVADFDTIELPRLTLNNAHAKVSFRRAADNTDGQLQLAAASAYGPARIDTGFRFMPGGLDLTGLDADAGGVRAKGAVSLRKNRPSTADLTVAIGPGALLNRGRIAGVVKIADAPGGAVADIDLTAKDASPAGGGLLITSGVLRGSGPMARLPITFEGRGVAAAGQWKINTSGVLSSEGPGYTLALNGSGQLGRADVRTLETAILRFGGPEQTARLRLAVGSGRADIDARLADGAAVINAVLNDVALNAFNEDMQGKIDATASLQGKGERLTGSLQANLRGARGRGIPQNLSLDGAIEARLDDTELAIDATATNAQGLRSKANVVLPVEASAAPLRLAIANRRPMRGEFFADGEVKPLWDLFLGGERSLAGHVTTQGTLGGTLADPQITGNATLANGSFDDSQTGLALRNLMLVSTFQGETVNVTGLSGTDRNGGKVSGAGRIDLRRNGASSFRLDLTRFQLVDNDLATAIATGQATINRNAKGQVNLVGALTIDRADIAANPPVPSGVTPMDVIEINLPPEREEGLQMEQSRGLNVALDVDLRAPQHVYVKGRGLDAELSLDAHVGGTTQHPDITGVAKVVRGDYDFAGKRFVFDQRGVVYLASSADRIRPDLTATRDDPTLTAVIRVKGTAAKPEITLTSTPVLPSDEVLSQVLFGASASQLSPVEAAQIASALAALAGGGGLDVIGNLRGLAHLDRLTFGGGQAGGLTVAGGKYLTDNVYLEIIGGGREGPAAQVEWRIKRSLAIVSRIAGQGGTRLSVRWRKDY
ncbi:MAG: translocation/assembly module TamB domain-containing protein [Parcubacteria group bacterium]